MQIAVLAGFTIDRINGRRTVGGPAYYSSLAALWMGVRPRIYSAVGRDFDHKWLEPLANMGADLSSVLFLDGKTTSFEVNYTPTGRILKVESVMNYSGELAKLNVSEKAAYVSYTFHEVDQDSLRSMLRNSVNMVDVQGFSRRMSSSRNVANFTPPIDAGLFRYLKLASDDVDNPESFISGLLEGGIHEVVLTRGSHGAVVHTKRAAYSLRVDQDIKEEHPTGAGDIFGMSYFVSRLTGSAIDQALARATDSAISAVSSTAFPKDYFKLREGHDQRVESLRKLVAKL
ncbi:MAG: hypothetical protein QW767_00945 [Thermoprotei archaeon]